MRDRSLPCPDRTRSCIRTGRAAPGPDALGVRRPPHHYFYNYHDYYCKYYYYYYYYYCVDVLYYYYYYYYHYYYYYYYDYYYYTIATIILIYYYYYYCNYSYYIAIIRSHFGTRAQVASRALLQEHGVPSAAAKAGGCVLCKLLHAWAEEELGWTLQGGSSTEQGCREREEERR